MTCFSREWSHIIGKRKFWGEWTTHIQKSHSTIAKGLYEWELSKC